MQDFIIYFIVMLMVILGISALVSAVAKPATSRIVSRRLEAIKATHTQRSTARVNDQMRRIMKASDTQLDAYFMRILPNPDQLRKKLTQTGKKWKLGEFLMTCCGLMVAVTVIAIFEGLPILLALLLGIIIGLGLPNMVLNSLIKRRVNAFTTRFPDAIDLLVRGLRSGLPITETMTVVADEVPGPIGVEFRHVSDAMKIGKTMDAGLQEVADRINTPEFQFFVITLAIQRETGGNLAETLSNLTDVLRKRAQMKLKIKAMSSESKASAYIIGVLPFIVFALIMFINPKYMGSFFTDQRLMIAGLGGLLWMSIGAFIMRQMINFEI